MPLDDKEINAIHNSDCIEWLNARPEGWADLVFADPPFNIGYQYDVYEDRKAYEDYYDWTEKWMGACTRALTPTGSFWIAIGDEYAAEVRMIGRKLGLTLRNWVMWYYTFGQCTKAKFARSHAHLFYFVRDPKVFTFNDKAVRVFSDRQREYHDKRANPDGKIPDDTWFDSRLCGTFGEREGWHPCQMPTSVLNRIVRACSNVGDIVFDPFTGSGTTAVAAKRLSRRYCGTEFSANYVENIRKRLDRTEPIAKWPAGASKRDWPALHVEELQSAYSEASVPTDLLHEHPHLMDAFANYFNWRLAAAGVNGTYPAADIWQMLEVLRKNGMSLPRIKVHAVEEKAGPIRPLGVGATKQADSPRPPSKPRTRSRKNAVEPSSLFAPGAGGPVDGSVTVDIKPSPPFAPDADGIAAAPGEQ